MFITLQIGFVIVQSILDGMDTVVLLLKIVLVERNGMCITLLANAQLELHGMELYVLELRSALEDKF